MFVRLSPKRSEFTISALCTSPYRPYQLPRVNTERWLTLLWPKLTNLSFSCLQGNTSSYSCKQHFCTSHEIFIWRQPKGTYKSAHQDTIESKLYVYPWSWCAANYIYPAYKKIHRALTNRHSVVRCHTLNWRVLKRASLRSWTIGWGCYCPNLLNKFCGLSGRK